MAFLRSVSRPCNSVILLKQLSGAGSVNVRSDFAINNSGKQQYYLQLRRELSTRFNAAATAKVVDDSSNKRLASNVAASGVQSNKDGTTSPKDLLDVSFNNATAAFKSKTTWELFRAYIVYLMCSSSFIVDNNLKVRKIFEEEILCNISIIMNESILVAAMHVCLLIRFLPNPQKTI